MDPYCNGAAYQGVIAMSFFECLQRGVEEMEGRGM